MTKIFLSYASEDLPIAQQLYFALSNLNHNVFLDKENLPPGEEYNFKIIDAIRGSDFSILLLSPEFFTESSYCKTELKIIQSNWPIPNGKIFPVMVREVSFDKIPDYIKSVTVMKSQGNLIAEIVQVIQDELFGFNSDDSISSKIRKLEIEKQLELLDYEWSQERKTHLVKVNNKEVTPTNELAIGIAVVFTAFAAFGYVVFANDSKFPTIWPTLIPLLIGIISFFNIRSKASKLQKAEKFYFERRASIMEEMPKIKWAT